MQVTPLQLTSRHPHRLILMTHLLLLDLLSISLMHSQASHILCKLSVCALLPQDSPCALKACTDPILQCSLAIRIHENWVGRSHASTSASTSTLTIAAIHMRKAIYLGCAHVKVVDGAEGVVLYMPAKSRHAAAHVQPWHHHTCDQLISNVVSQN